MVMIFSSSLGTTAALLLLAITAVSAGGNVHKADCFPSTDCEGPFLYNGDGTCRLPARQSLYNDPIYPLGSGYIQAYYMGPTINGHLREDKCHTRKSTNSDSEAIQFCFDIGAKSACVWKHSGCDCMTNPMSWGDPHFRSFGGVDFDFHGVCDLVLFKSEAMNTTIHVRTEEKFEFSYISSAAIQINNDILEVGSWGEFVMNGIDDSDLPPTIGGDAKYPLEMQYVDKKNTVFTIDVGSGQLIRLKAYKSMVAVSLQLSEHGGFRNSTGIMGSGMTGEKLGRDGVTVYDEHHNNEYGFEWQVRDDEPLLFDAVREPQYPQQCVMPSKQMFEKRRRLGEMMAREEAEEACAKWGLNKESCIYDVMVTGDLGAAQAGVF